MSSTKIRTNSLYSDEKEYERIKQGLKENINLICKNVIRRLSQDPQYENVKMGQVKKMLIDNYLSNSKQKNNENLSRLSKNSAIEIDLDETDDETVKITEKTRKSIYLPAHDLSLDEFCKTFKEKIQINKAGPARKSQSVSKYMLASMSRKNRIIKDSYRVKIIKRPYSKDTNNSAVERIKDRKNKQNLARIAREVKKKFEKQFLETSNSFRDYIIENRKRSLQKTEQSKRGKLFTPALTPGPRVPQSQEGQFTNISSYNDCSTQPEFIKVGMRRIRKQSKLHVTTDIDKESMPNILNQESSSHQYNRSQSKEKNFVVPSIKDLVKRGLAPNSPASFKYSALSGLEECDIPDTLRRMQEYLIKHEVNPKPASFFIFIKHLVKLCEEMKCFDLEFHSKKMQGDFHVELRKIDEAKEVYTKLVKLADKHNKYKELMIMYQQIGYCDHVMRRYDEAIIWFKKLLELAWFEKDNEAETIAYINMATSYFFQGDLDKANYYHDRMMGGKLENEKSSLKTMSYNVLKNRRDLKNDKKFRRKQVAVVKPQNQTLPSPREHHKTNSLIDPTVNLLPHYFVGEDIVFQEALKEYSRKMKYNLFRKGSKLLEVIDTHKFLEEKKNKADGSSTSGHPMVEEFKRPELQYLNRKPKMPYLRKEKSKKR
ncbi:unnamed protein product [Moneuplotes crassus]|uniref:Uncharacterized protein n=2 Tax=Euplotes crassus TaxID=5936 RepID=A0AAD1Y0P8_EUPCR|nr:unnamed protein product [Moneuplotes crassus]